MRKTLQLLTVSVSAAAVVLSGAGVASAKNSAPAAYTCAGGAIPSGSYAAITVTGPCEVPAGAVISVTGDVHVAAGAMLDAQSAPSTIIVGRNVIAGQGSLLGLGCQPPSYTGNSGHECAVEPEGHSSVTIKGSVTAAGANTVLLNGVTIGGNVTLAGGGGDIPWSIKNNVIGGNVTVVGQRVIWIGVQFNRIDGNATLAGITVTDPDPEPRVFIVRNTIKRNLICVGLRPGVSGGFNPAAKNVVGRSAIGQCAALA